MPSRSDIGMGILFILTGVLIYFLGRLSVHKPIEEIGLPDNSVFEKRIDSLAAENDKLKNINKILLVSFDSLKLIKTNNNKKVNHEVKKIDNYTNADLRRFNDSVAKSNGL